MHSKDTRKRGFLYQLIGLSYCVSTITICELCEIKPFYTSTCTIYGCRQFQCQVHMTQFLPLQHRSWLNKTCTHPNAISCLFCLQFFRNSILVEATWCIYFIMYALDTLSKLTGAFHITFYLRDIYISFSKNNFQCSF